MLSIDRLTASRLGITPQKLDNTLYDAFGQRQVSIMYTPLNQYHVVMEVEPQFWQNPNGLRYIYVGASQRQPGAAERGRQIRAYPPRRWPSTIRARFPSVTFSFNLAPGVALGDAVESIDEAERRSACPPPSRPATRAPRRRIRIRSPPSRC